MRAWLAKTFADVKWGEVMTKVLLALVPVIFAGLYAVNDRVKDNKEEQRRVEAHQDSVRIKQYDSLRTEIRRIKRVLKKRYGITESDFEGPPAPPARKPSLWQRWFGRK